MSRLLDELLDAEIEAKERYVRETEFEINELSLNMTALIREKEKTANEIKELQRIRAENWAVMHSPFGCVSGGCARAISGKLIVVTSLREAPKLWLLRLF